ncbi:energy transducer TonB, partial [Roseococcus sp. SDR]|uniref:energy transducer TonB n=1 Tax=Roseococcus sp. SDR TaxID=2835532 RepID=UPI001BCB4F6C
PSPPRPAPVAASTAAPPPVATAAASAAAAPAPVARQPPANYVGRLLAALDRHKEYPSAARYRRAEGVTLLRFAMRRDGTVAAFRIERSSGHEDLDAAVLRMIERASPLPPPPPELPGDPVELVVPVRFSLR